MRNARNMPAELRSLAMSLPVPDCKLCEDAAGYIETMERARARMVRMVRADPMAAAGLGYALGMMDGWDGPDGA